MIKTNIDKVPKIIVQGTISHSIFNKFGKMGVEGEIYFLVGTGGITLNARIGDSAIGWEADHLEPGVSIKNEKEAFNQALMAYSCIGNEAIVKTGDAKGAKGIVTGKHSGIDHVMIDFDDETMQKLSIGDKIDILACGQGMKLLDYESVILRNLSFSLLERMHIEEQEGKLRVGVAKIVPACIMGSGLGDYSYEGDYDITLFDEAITQKYHLDELRFGDIVAITDADTRYGRTYKSGSVTIGVVVHSDCKIPGHGPGVTTLMSTKEEVITVVLDEQANLRDLFKRL